MTLADFESLWTAAEAAERVGVDQSTIRQWVRRGHLPVAERTSAGHLRLDPLDVARAEYTTRTYAQRLARRIAG